MMVTVAFCICKRMPLLNRMKYQLMHDDTPVATVELNEELGNMERIVEIHDRDHLPIGTVKDGTFDGGALRNWWFGRSIPATRSGLHHMLDSLGIVAPTSLLSRSMGLSLSDHYWIKPPDSNLCWSDVNFFENPFSDDVGNLLFGKNMEEWELNLSSPDNTSEGNLKKRWMIMNSERNLIKSGSGATMQEPFNECIATILMQSQDIPCAEYEMMWSDGEPYSICRDFVDLETELVTCAHVCDMHKRSNNDSLYTHYVKCCLTQGLDIVPALDRMIVVDFLMMNTDRHLNNFGIIRDPRTLKWLYAAPIYDTGASLAYDFSTEMIHPWMSPLECKPFGKSLEDELGFVSSFGWIDFGKLRAALPAVKDILDSDRGRISESRVDAVMALLAHRIDSLEMHVCRC